MVYHSHLNRTAKKKFLQSIQSKTLIQKDTGRFTALSMFHVQKYWPVQQGCLISEKKAISGNNKLNEIMCEIPIGWSDADWS